MTLILTMEEDEIPPRAVIDCDWCGRQIKIYDGETSDVFETEDGATICESCHDDPPGIDDFYDDVPSSYHEV